MLEISFRRGDNHEVVKLDKLVSSPRVKMWEPRHMYAASMVGTDTQIKAVRAMINGDKKTSTRIYVDSHDYVLASEGYTIAISRFPKYSTAHMVIRAKTDRVLIGSKDVEMRRYLLSKAIDSPLLPEWIPAIAKRLEEIGGVMDLESIGNVEANWIKFTSNHVDDAISHLLQNGMIRIPGAKPALMTA